MSKQKKPTGLAEERVIDVRTAGRCPICQAPVEPRYRPFCSKRCADVDLGRWLKESYRIPTEETPGDTAEDDGRDY